MTAIFKDGRREGRIIKKVTFELLSPKHAACNVLLSVLPDLVACGSSPRGKS